MISGTKKTEEEANNKILGWQCNINTRKGDILIFPENGGDPIIHVRTWQPEWAGGKRQQPDDDISTLGGFDL